MNSHKHNAQIQSYLKLSKDKKLIIVAGAPASGKTTTFVKDVANITDGHVWVFEPVQKIVEEKRAAVKAAESINSEATNISYINYARGFGIDFYLKEYLQGLQINKSKDIIVIDEAHQIFYSKFRGFDIDSLREIIALYSDNLVFITATPEILKTFLRLEKVKFDIIEYEQRLKREQIKINIIPTKFKTFINEKKAQDYDIILTNNIKNLKKVEVLAGDTKNDFSFIFSNFSEINHSLFEQNKFEKNKHSSDSIIVSNINNSLFKGSEPDVLKNKKWVGTSAMGQGIDKFQTESVGIGKILVDGNTLMSVPDDVKEVYKEKKGIDYYRVAFKSLAENVIQADRFRIDLDIMEVSVLVKIEIDLEDEDGLKKNAELYALLEDELRNYFEIVYNKSRSISSNLGHALYSKRIPNFSFEQFQKEFKQYNPGHRLNRKSSRARFSELLSAWCNPIQEDKRIKKHGDIQATIAYFREIFLKFFEYAEFISVNDNNKNNSEYYIPVEAVNDIFFHNQSIRRVNNFIMQKSMIEFLEYLSEEDIKNIFLEFVTEKMRKADEGKTKEELDNDLKEAGGVPKTPISELYKNMGYFIESLLQIIFGHYNFQNYSQKTENKRKASPIFHLTKPLRYLITIGSIDLVGSHVTALWKKIKGQDFHVTSELVNSMYSYEAAGGKTNVINYLNTVSAFKKMSFDEIAKQLGTERQICKHALLIAINKSKFRNRNEYDYLKTVFINSGGPANLDLNSYGQIGYYNGRDYENKWFKKIKGKGVIFRIADAMVQVYGDLDKLVSIKKEIEKEFKIPMSFENIEANNKLGLEHDFEYFIKKNNEKFFPNNIKHSNSDVLQLSKTENEIIITDKMIKDSFLEMLDSLENFRNYANKGKAKGKAVNLKKYEILEDFTVKKTGVTYKKGFYEWGFIPKDIPKHYKTQYLSKMVWSK